MTPRLELRTAEAAELGWAWELYRESLEPLGLALGTWSEADERRVVATAFAALEVVTLRALGERVGWMHVKWTSRSVELWQLFVEPQRRGRGLGTAVLRELKTQAAERRCPILLAVLRNNRARHLYLREGFVTHAEGPAHWFMAWHPEASRK